MIKVGPRQIDKRREELAAFTGTQKINGPKVCRSECQDAIVRLRRSRAITPLAIESCAPLREIGIRTHVEVTEYTIAKEVEKPKRLCWAMFGEALRGVVLDEVTSILFRESPLPPAPLKSRLWRLSVPERHRVITEGRGIP